ncbi:DNA-processing protein DprA [Desulfamplus magnetovallimortis]|nr:DNA-processing protein DprA [Desulfamplus magnetovallimortis]
MMQYKSWLLLKSVPGLGNILYKRLIERFEHPDNVFSAHIYDLGQINGMGKRVISAIKNCRITKEIEDELNQIHNKGFRIITLIDEEYPPLLKQIPDPPPYFTCLGNLDNSYPSIAIVGSRKATAYGLGTAEKLGYDLASRGFQVTSGMALGIDTAAHEGALKAGGKTIAVLGSGLANIYPRGNRDLFKKIAANGAVISEFKVHAIPDPRHFPIRNRIISGISTGTIVVEAAAKSGSLITARLAAEYDREVFAVPGNIQSSNTTGTHALLKQGAKLVENYEDVMEELHHMIHERPSINGDNPDIDTTPARGEGFQNLDICTNSTRRENVHNPNNCTTSTRTKTSSCDAEVTAQNSSIKKIAGRSSKQSIPITQQSLFTQDKHQNEIITMLENSSPLHIDVIIDKSSASTAEVTAALLDLELSGIIMQKPGKMFCLAYPAPH